MVRSLAYRTFLFLRFPLLLWVAALFVAVSYWIEKWYLLRCCRQPPAFSADLLVTMSYALPAAVLAHCVIGYVFSNSELERIFFYS